MKRIIIIWVSLLLLVGLISCSKSGGGTGPGDFQSDFPNTEEEREKIDYAMGFFDLDLKSLELTVFSKDSVYSSELKINDIEILLSFEMLSWESMWGEWYAYVYDDSLLNALNSGDTISYSLSINNEKFTGNLTIVYEPYVTAPETFDFNSDYTFNWTIEKNPNIHLCEFFIESDVYDDCEYYWEISGSKREYTIKKKFFVNYEDGCDIEVSLLCYNYKNHGKCLVYSCSYDSIEEFDEYSKNSDRVIFKSIERRRESLNNLLKILDHTTSQILYR